MELVPPPERVTLPAGVNLVQCFVCTAMFYTQEDHDKHLKLHRKADIVRAVTEHRLHHHHHVHPHRGGGGGGVLRPAAAPDASYKLDEVAAAAAVAQHQHQHQHEISGHSHHPPHQSHHVHHVSHAAAHHTHHSQHAHHVPPAHSAHSAHPAWLEVPLAHDRAPPPPPPPPPLAHPSTHHQIMVPELHSLHSWPFLGAAGDSGHHDIIYTDLEPGPSGSGHSEEPPPSVPAPAPAPAEPELPAAELLCTEESLHSSCPSPGEPAVLRAAPEYGPPQDFSMYGGEQTVAGPPPAYSGSPSRRAHLTLPADQPEPGFITPTADGHSAAQDFVRFKCIHCSREFNSAEEIHLHLSEVSEASYVCQVCHEVCASTWHLGEHMDRHSSPRPFKCGVCAREFRSSSLHRQHILQHIPARIRDRVANELPGSPIAAAAAAAAAAGASSSPLAVPSLSAPVVSAAAAQVAPSPAVAPSSRSLTHRAAPKAAKAAPAKPELKKPVSCATCGAQFALVSALQRHTLQQHKQQRRRPTRRICSCNHCGRIFYSYKQLRWHAEIHGKKPHTCATCGLRFLHESWLTRHIRAQHDPSHLGPHSGDSKPCPICTRVYMRSSLQKHIRMMHQELKPFQCTRCGKRFAAKCNLQSHELSHLSYRDRPHKCTRCRKAYTTARDLRIHMATHEGKKYPCKVCGREFSRASSMNLHLREHGGEKKHMCGVCGKRFARKAYLMGHVRIHTGERPHECTVCGRSFASRSNYNAHVRSHTRREPVNAEL